MRATLRIAGVVGALLLASCGRSDVSDEVALDSAEMAGQPDVAPTAAPGVSWRFEYDFRLADERIDDVQEAHAAHCEALGIARCRITGMRYSIDAQEQVYGMLQVKLDPRIARQFGKSAVEGVEQSGGQLINAEFTGQDEGDTLRRNTAQQDELERQIAEIEQRLAALPANARERIELQQQLAQLRTQLSATRSSIDDSEERLASTPMTLNYSGKGGVPGFRGRNPVEDAWRAFVESGATMISVALYLIGVLLPWALLLLLILLLVRSRAGRAVRSWFRTTSYKEGSTDS
jgi:hypothetical protein